ncbi:ABC transporter substrate-binding protein [Rugamonas apoptosis]|uniref:ABC transporter substrate-binding protein n=1 Tax=Rugamonas apoptosis TaxID=2758570 RepID=A0A7W2FFJ4_9BURK|nr:ABC transporter substrate-binding protein [Rugamonas apoptosis]
MPKVPATALALSASMFFTSLTFAQTVPAGYPASYAATIAAAVKEGTLVIYSTTDSKAVEPLIRDFRAEYPGITVEYNDMNSTEIYNRFLSEQAAGGASADLTWSSAMDLQMKLVHDGGALQYKTPEATHIPAWANWKDMAYGTTFEPAAFVYNKRLVSDAEVPQTHAELAKLVTDKPEKFGKKVTAFDIEKSGVGYMYITQDAKANPDFWNFARSVQHAGLRVQSSVGIMLERIASGEQLIGFNLHGSYAYARAKKDPSIGVVIPKDYVLVMSRVIFISKGARHPNAAKLWLDYTLSKRGQSVIANQAELYSLRTDVEGESTAAALARLRPGVLKPIPLNEELLGNLDQKRRLDFFKQWKEAAVK